MTGLTGSYAASYLPWILIPFICWLFPLLVSGIAFLYIEADEGSDIPG